MTSCDGRVAVVTGAGAGIGRATALLFAQEGARVVVNDVSADNAQAVADEITAAGGEALVSAHDVSDWDAAEALVRTAVDGFGRLDTLVNNAGILRDRMFVNMTVDEWDAVIRVHLRGAFCPTKHAAVHWREQSKSGAEVTARVVNTSSPSGLYATVGQANYGAAKSGIASFTQILAQELWRYGVLCNAIAPSALTAMTEGLSGYVERLQEIEERTGWKDPGAPENIVALTVWLGSPLCTVNGQVLNVRAGHVSVAEPWRPGPAAEKVGPWDVTELDGVVPGLVEKAVSLTDAYGRPKAFGG